MSYAAWSATTALPHLLTAAAADDSSPEEARLSLSYECSCGRLSPSLAPLYWCRSCSGLQCGLCTSSSVDTYFCPSCLNSVFTTPAFANQNRCEQCVTCPGCNCTLATRASATAGGQSVYAYYCEYCKWSSEEFVPPAGASRAAIAPGSPPNPLVSPEANLLSARAKDAEGNPGQAETFGYLLAHHRARHRAAQAAATAGQHAALGFTSSGSTLLSSSTTGGRSTRARLFDEFEALLAVSDAANPLVAGVDPSSGGRALSRVASLSTAGTTSPDGVAHGLEGLNLDSSNVSRWLEWRAAREEMLHKQSYTLPSDAVHNAFDPVEPMLLGGGAVGDGVEDGVSTLAQRLAHPATQHVQARCLPPRRKPLATKVAHRCRSCHKHLVKPGPGASKASFEILQAALAFVPCVTVAPFENLRVGSTADITLFFKNPVEKPMRLWLSLPSDASSNTAQVDFPLAARVAVAAYDDMPEEGAAAALADVVTEAEQAEGLVVSRQASKVGLRLRVTPLPERAATAGTRFVLVVNMQPDEPAQAVSSPVKEAGSSTEAAATPTPAPAPQPITSFTLHVNLGLALAQ